MVVNRYQIIKGLGADFNDLVILDIIPAKMLKWLECYETYLKHKGNGRQKALKLVAEMHGITERTLYKIITFMETG